MFVHQIHGYFAVVFISQIWEVINPFTADDVYILKYQGRKAPVESDEALNLALLHLRSGTEPDNDLALYGSHFTRIFEKNLGNEPENAQYLQNNKEITLQHICFSETRDHCASDKANIR